MPIEYWLRVGRAYASIRALPYTGSAVACPCCGGSFRHFLPGGVVRRPNAVCPRCGSLERHRLLMLYLEQETTLFRDRLRVLHVAPEPPIYRRIAKLPNLTYVPAGMGSALARVPMDITNVTYSDASFDAIICVHVLEHVPDDLTAMREFQRILRPGGWAILQVPIDRDRSTTYEDWNITDPMDRFRAFGQNDHVRVYGLDYAERLRQAGFQVDVYEYAKHLGHDKARQFGLSEDEAVYVCRQHSSNRPVIGTDGGTGPM